MPSQQLALSLKLLICVSVECRGVEELISFDFSMQELLLYLEPNLEILTFPSTEARLHVKCTLYI